MKRLVGGDYLLDLSPIEIEESVDGETYTSITDKSVLDQLTGLKAFIGKSGMIKPIWVKLLNGETDEIVATRGSLSTSDGVTFLIKVLLVGFILALSVEFTQAETDDHTPLDEWYIDSNDAKYILVSNTQSLAKELADFEGDVSITGDLSVTGSINGEENPSVKPLYFHPITIKNNESYTAWQTSLIIINNSSEPIDTWAKLTNFFNDVYDGLPEGINVARFPCTGFMKSATATIVTSVIEIAGKTDGTRYILGMDTSNSTYLSLTASDIQGAPRVYDGVNKIN